MSLAVSLDNAGKYCGERMTYFCIEAGVLR
jgi:hypothetical protein